MPRTKSRPSRSSTVPRSPRASRGGASHKAIRSEDVTKIRRYLDFVRTVVGSTTRNGR